MNAGAPSAQEVLAEWTIGDPGNDFAKWQEGLGRYEKGGLSSPAELDEAAELMCAGLATYAAGRSVISGWGSDSPQTAVARTTWNILAATFDERPAGRLSPAAERRLRLALVVVRGCAYQPLELGGDGFMARFFDSQARELMAVALSASPALAGESPISLETWFESGATCEEASDPVAGVAAPDAVAGYQSGQGPGPLGSSRWEAAKGRARQAQQHVNPLALQHGIEAVQGALTGASLAKVDKNSGKLKVKKIGVAKAVLRPAKTARQAVEGAALAERLKAYNDSVRTLPAAASAAEFASYPSKADYLRDWARQLIVAAGVTPTAPLIAEYADRAANGVIDTVFRPMRIGLDLVDPGGSMAAGLPRPSGDDFDRMYQAAAEIDADQHLMEEQVVAFLNERRSEWMASIRGTST